MVSVIIITYKRTQFISRAIESVLTQTYPYFELIVVDDNNPNTVYRKDLEKIMEKYENNEKVKFIQHEYNKNGSAARNTGISAARGEYIAFLDDDDYFLPNRLEVLVELLEKNKEYNGVYSSVIVTNNKKIIGLIEATKSGNLKKELLLDEFSFGTGSNLFFRTSCINDLNGFDESFLRHQDIEFMLRFFNYNKLLSCYEPLVIKVQDERNNEPDLEKMIQIKQKYIESFKKDIDSLDDFTKETVYRVNCKHLLNLCIKSKKYSSFLHIYKYYKFRFGVSIKDILKFVTLAINNYIKIENVKYLIIMLKTISKFQDKVELITQYESKEK